jgi:hypothetical protein
MMFFIGRTMAEPGGLDERAFRRPPLHSGLLQARPAKGVHLCSHTYRGLNATQQPNSCLHSHRSRSAT